MRVRFVAPREINMSLRYYEASLSVTCSAIVKLRALLLCLHSPLLALGRVFSFLVLYTVGRTPWAGDQPFARPLPTHNNTNTE
jgi:hypothetical protein